MDTSDVLERHKRTMKDLDTVFRFRLPAELLEAAKAKAEREDVSLAQVLRRCLRTWVGNPPRGEEGDQEKK
jgi:predicted HicB family RNase H-like nuclease